MNVAETARGQILEYLETVKGEIIDLAISKNMVASGRTLASLEVIPSNTGGKLVAASHIIFLEDGRGPTKSGGGGEPLVDIIAQWISDKGLEAKLNPYAVAKTIHEKGTRLFRQGGKSGVLSIPLNGAGLSNLYSEIATLYKQSVSSEIYSPINELNNA